MNTVRYPIDVSELEVGDVISVDQVEEIYGCDRKDRLYFSRLLSLRDFIMQAALDELGETWTVIRQRDGLRILTHKEAADHNPHESKLLRQRLGRVHRRNMGVDTSGFSDERRDRHLRQLELDARVFQAEKKERKAFRLEAAKRHTPGLIKKKDEDE